MAIFHSYMSEFDQFVRNLVYIHTNTDHITNNFNIENWFFCLKIPHLNRTRKYLWNTNRPQPPPNSKGYGFCRFKIYFLRKPLFLANLTTSGRVFLTEMVKRHIYGPKPFIWAYNLVSKTFRSKVLARTSSSLEKLLFWAILVNLTISGGVFFDWKGQKAHLRAKTFYLSL